MLVTGAAGFIGYHFCKKELEKGKDVVGIDNLNDYYSVDLKKSRLQELEKYENFTFYKRDIQENLDDVFEKHDIEVVVNLAAQAGVRYSLENPKAYIDSNINGFFNVINTSKKFEVNHFMYASSSSVYGGNTKIPFSTNDNVDHPVSLYAATKKSNELIAHTYSHLYGLPTTGLRFFTVYGSWGRPDMAYFSFTDKIYANEEIKVFNYGKMKRDFTHVSDIVEGMSRLVEKPPQRNSNWIKNEESISESHAPYKVYNIGNNNPIPLMEFINTLEKVIGKEAQKDFIEMQKGDVLATYADVDDLKKDVGFNPDTDLENGLTEFIEWYREYYQVKE